MKNTWDDLKAEMKSIIGGCRAAAEEPSPAPQPATPKKGPKSPLYLLGLIVLACTLGVAIFAQKKEEPISVQTMPTAPKVTVDVERLAQRVKTHDDLLRLLGAANNNNWYTLYNKCPAEDIVYFGSDWKLNRIPPHVKSDNGDAERLYADWAN